MKIIQAPENYGKAWSDKRVCENDECRAVLLVEEADLTRHHSFDPRDGKGWDCATFQCPVCKTTQRVNDRLPYYVKARLKEA